MRKLELDATAVPFVLVHLGAIAGVAWVGVGWAELWLCLALYYVRMFGITAGYHRYFAHRAYKTGRVFQFILAFLGTLSVQKGVLWWAAHHRDHHRLSDTADDIHSPRQGFWWSHTLWFLSRRFDETNYDRVRDFARYPELVWLNEHPLLPPVLVGAALWWWSPSALVWGGLVSTALLWHGTFTINSLAHILGKKRYESGDDSKNSFILAVLTMGEGWHNNHHYYQSSANQGFFWWELDLSYYLLKALSWVGVTWDLRTPPERALRGELNGPTPRRLREEPEEQPTLEAA